MAGIARGFSFKMTRFLIFDVELARTLGYATVVLGSKPLTIVIAPNGTAENHPSSESEGLHVPESMAKVR